MPDRRANERMLSQIGRYFEAHPPANQEEMQRVLQTRFSGKIDDTLLPATTPTEKAQELCYQACETRGRRRVQLARQALSMCPDCAEAYVILAEQAGTLEDEAGYYAQAVAAGERMLGPDAFQRDCGHFWGIVETRPYMRARQGLAQALAELGRIEEAVVHYQELLRLNPHDNQGIRYLLMPTLLELGRDADAARLLKEYDEGTANWTYARALLAFRLSGKSAPPRKELRAALRANPHVPPYLLADEPLPHVESYSLGSPEEAVCCAAELGPVFRATPGAAEWLTSECRQYEKERDARLREKVRREKGSRGKRDRR
jgi:tetratricopeptide (TPR) repeat protein